MILHHYIWGDIDIDIVEEVAPHFLIAKHYGNLALFCRLTKHQSHYFRNSDKRFYAAGFDDEGKSMNPSDEYIPFVPDILYDDDGIGYLCLMQPSWLHTIDDIVYTYTVETTDKSVMENTATIKYTHDGEQYEIPSNPVDVEKPDDGVVTIRKAADKTEVEPGETVTYTVTVHNGKNHDIENARLTDANNFAGEIVGIDGAGYTFKDGEFIIDKIAAGADVVIHYDIWMDVFCRISNY